MKKALSLLAAVAVVAMATSAMAADMLASKHNMWSYTGNNVATTTGTNKEVCVFCHTPHNSAKNRALWNRTKSNETFKLYTSGANASADNWFQSNTKGALHSDSLSLMCLSCHDGVSSIGGLVVNKKGTISLQNDVMDAGVKTTLGTDLTNDHPINVVYATVVAALPNKLAADQTAITARATSGLASNAAKLLNGYVECASCHDVHNSANVPFLRDTMAGSVLCLQCHIK